MDRVFLEMWQRFPRLATPPTSHSDNFSGSSKSYFSFQKLADCEVSLNIRPRRFSRFRHSDIFSLHPSEDHIFQEIFMEMRLGPRCPVFAALGRNTLLHVAAIEGRICSLEPGEGIMRDPISKLETENFASCPEEWKHTIHVTLTIEQNIPVKTPFYATKCQLNCVLHRHKIISDFPLDFPLFSRPNCLRSRMPVPAFNDLLMIDFTFCSQGSINHSERGSFANIIVVGVHTLISKQFVFF